MTLDVTTARILVLILDRQRQRSVLDALQGWPSVVTSRDEPPGEICFDVLITDDLREIDVQNESEGVGIIGIGVEQADVVLSDDASPNELRLACRLLAEIVRLKRAQREARDVQRELTQLAERDPLTGLANRRAWDIELIRRRQLAHDDQSTLCVAMLDLDLFKSVNDQLGHAAGDDVLRTTAQALSSAVRQDDFVVRLGGDEFGLLISDLAAEHAGTVCERIRGHVVQRLSNAAAPITASLGYHHASGSLIPSATELFELASRALVQAKHAGRNQTSG